MTTTDDIPAATTATPTTRSTSSTTSPPSKQTSSTSSPAAATAATGDDANKGASTSLNTNAAPPGHALRRARTTADGTRAFASTPSINFKSSSNASSDFNPTGPQRRSSNFSEYSLSEARSILNPQPQEDHASGEGESSSSLAGLSLAFALLPALAGILFKNGSALVTDVMLLGLAGVFLHWSVTQPWAWYHSAQEVRMRNEELEEAVFEDYGEAQQPAVQVPVKNSHLDHVPEEKEEHDGDDHDDDDDDDRSGSDGPKSVSSDSTKLIYQRAAMRELRVYEILALVSCFAMPLIGAYLLHAIRSQLSRPSEGLVSNYNLTIFLLVSEMRVASHLLKLLRSRTLHLQRIVQGSSPHSAESKSRVEVALERLAKLEALWETKSPPSQPENVQNGSGRALQEAHVAREVRNIIQPELDALNRAVRRYEKKATLLQLQTESRFSSVDARVDDAVALAAAAAKNQVRQGKGWMMRTTESVLALLLLPFHLLTQLLLLPVKTLTGFTRWGKGKAPPSQHGGKSSRGRNGSLQAGQRKWSGDRFSSRMSKR